MKGHREMRLPASPCGEIVPTRATARIVAAGLLVFLSLNLLMYANDLPVYHEEPRRLIIAQEMLFSGDLATPTVLQEPYYKKPPLHNWFIAGVSAALGGVSAFSGRLVSVLALALLGLAVYFLIEPEDPQIALVALLATTTNYLLFAGYGNKAEPDLTLTLFTFLSYAVYIRHPTRRGSVVLSGLFMGCGILTKGISPIFFYPAMVLHTARLKEERAARAKYLGLHLCTALLLPLLWIGIYAVRGNLGEMLYTMSDQVSSRTEGGMGDFLVHLVTFPAEVLVVMLPWSLLLLLAPRPVHRGSEVYRTSRLIFITSLVLFLLVTHGRPRYFMPALPFLCVAAAYHFDGRRVLSSRLTRFAVTAVAVVAAGLMLYMAVTGHFIQAGVFALLCLVSVVLRGRPLNALQLASGLALSMALVQTHALYLLRSEKFYDYRATAHQIARAMPEELPVVVSGNEVPIQTAFYLEAQLGRPLYRTPTPGLATYYVLTSPEHAVQRGEELLRVPYPKTDLPELVLQRVGGRGGR